MLWRHRLSAIGLAAALAVGCSVERPTGAAPAGSGSALTALSHAAPAWPAASARVVDSPRPPPQAPQRHLPFTDPDRVREINRTLDLIEQGGPFPFSQDGVVFLNREHRLADRPPGYYHEFTVVTPGAHDRGARRIIQGKAKDTYYTDDHYRTFIPIDPERH